MFIPVKLSIKAIVLPTQDQVETRYPFTFYLLENHWSYCSSNWASSVIYLIKCSSQASNNILNFTMNEILESCNSHYTSQLQKTFCFKDPLVSGPVQPNPSILMLSITKLGILEKLTLSHVDMGLLTISNIWKQFCGNATNVRYIYEISDPIYGYGYYARYTTKPLKCSELITSYPLHKSFFNRDNTFKIQVLIASFQYAELQFTEDFMQIVKNVKNKFELMYRWQSRKVRCTSGLKKTFKVFFHEEEISWVHAYKECLSYNMTLPSFQNQRHVEDMLDFIQEEYQFQPIAMFTAHLHSVGVSNIF